MIFNRTIGLVLVFCLVQARLTATQDAGKIALEIEDTVTAYLDAGYELRLAMRGTSSSASATGEFTVVNEKGQIAARGALKSGKLDGDFLIYADDGRILALSRFLMGKPTGTSVSWDRNGAIHSITGYDDGGKKHGNETAYRDGVIVNEIMWEHGSPVEVRVHGTESKVLRGPEMMDWFKQRAALRNQAAAAAPSP
jgi:hypothetical protein